MVATAYPDRRDGVQTPAHTLGDDSLLIKYINPRLFAFATLSPEDAGTGEVAGGGAGDLNGKGQELTVSVGAVRPSPGLERCSKGCSSGGRFLCLAVGVGLSYTSYTGGHSKLPTLSKLGVCACTFAPALRKTVLWVADRAAGGFALIVTICRAG